MFWQEQVDDQDDQQQCQSERDDDIVDAEQDRPGRVDDRVIVHSLGERLRELPHRGVDLLTYLDGIAAGDWLIMIMLEGCCW